jgi:hypothetical protein
MPGNKAHASTYRLDNRSHYKPLEKRAQAGQNYLKGSVGDAHNALLAGMEFNLMLFLRELAGNFLATMFWGFFYLVLSRKLRLSQNYTCS